MFFTFLCSLNFDGFASNKICSVNISSGNLKVKSFELDSFPSNVKT